MKPRNSQETSARGHAPLSPFLWGNERHRVQVKGWLRGLQAAGVGPGSVWALALRRLGQRDADSRMEPVSERCASQL